MTNSEAIVTTPPEVVRTRASSTVFVKASSRVNRDLAGIVASECALQRLCGRQWAEERTSGPFQVIDGEVKTCAQLVKSNRPDPEVNSGLGDVMNVLQFNRCCMWWSSLVLFVHVQFESSN